MKRRPTPLDFLMIAALILFCGAMFAIHLADAAEKEVVASIGHGKIVAWFYPEMNKKATLITRTIDCEAGVVVYTANSHTYGYAVATSVIPIKDTILLIREVCNGTNQNK